MITTDPRVARFVSERLGFGLCPPFTCMGIERDGEIIAGVLFNHFEGYDVHITAAGKGWTRQFLEAVGEYVFDQLGCLRMTMVTADPNVGLLAERLGGEREGLMADHFGPGIPGRLYGVLRDDYRYKRKALHLLP